MSIIINGYELFKIIGEGSFGKIYLTIKGNNPELLVTKDIDISTIKDENILNYIKQEKEIMKSLVHPNIVRLDNFIEHNNHYYFIMEYCNGGNLSDLLDNYMKKYRKPFSIEIIQYLMLQLVEGIKYIHSKNIIHRDIKLQNILIHFKNIRRKSEEDTIDFNELKYNDLLNCTIKIIDFGLSTILGPNELATSYVGNPYNMDPFIIKEYQKNGGFDKSQGYNEKADIWSLGTICYQLLTGVPLFTLYNLDTLIKKVEEGNYSIPLDIEISNEILSFLGSMLKYDEDLRASAEQLLNHDFLKKKIKDFTKIDYQKIPEKKDIHYIIIKALRNSNDINNNKELENQNEKYLNYIEYLYNDYKAIKQYFKENDLPEREKDAAQKCKQIENIKKQLNSGIKKINLNILPKKITPEYVYGCDILERNKKFKEILSAKRAEKNLLEVKIKIYQKDETTKKGKDEYEKNKIKYKQLKKEIEDLEEKSKNVWVPPPKYIKKIQKQPKEIISFDKSEFKIKTNIKRIDNINGSLDLIISLIVNQTKKFEEKVKLKERNSFGERIWKLSAEEWMNIDNNINNFMLGITVNKNNNPFQNILVDVSKIKNGKEINFNQPINDNKTINISILPILPEGEKYITTEEKEILSVKKLYPPFELKSKNDYFIMKSFQINMKHCNKNH